MQIKCFNLIVYGLPDANGCTRNMRARRSITDKHALNWVELRRWAKPKTVRRKRGKKYSINNYSYNNWMKMHFYLIPFHFKIELRGNLPIWLISFVISSPKKKPHRSPSWDTLSHSLWGRGERDRQCGIIICTKF